MDKLLTSKEVCAYLHIGRSTLYNWVGTGKLKPRKIGRNLLFLEAEITALLDSSIVLNTDFDLRGV